MKRNIDAVTTEVIRNAYNSIAEDMGVVLSRSAYSPVIYESHDYGVALFNDRAETLGQAPGLPLFTGGLDAGVLAVIERFGRDDLNAGDVFVVNDSYVTGGHLNDVDIIGVIRHRDDLVGFACIRAHWIDVGMADPGFPVNTTQIFQEGLRLGPTRVMHRGEWVRDIVDILKLNSRKPETLAGDMAAQVASAKMGIRRFCELIDRFGLETVRACTEQIFDSTEAKFRAFIQAIPDGVYVAEGCSDNDYISPDPVPVKITVTIKGSDMIVDTAGSSRQRAGGLNCGFANAMSAARLALALLYPDPNPEINHGSFRPMLFKAERGTIFHAEAPAACMRPHPVMLLTDLIIKALAPALPDAVAAGLPGDSWNVGIMGDHPAGGFFVSVESLCGGWGANARTDGVSAVTHSAAGDFRNVPIETLEHRFPIRINRLQFGRDSAGAGRHRGGLNVVKEYELLSDARVSVHFDRTETPQWGLFGGLEGAKPKVTFDPIDSQPRRLNKAEQIAMKRGSRLLCETGGGGGYGDPLTRDPEEVRKDLLSRFITQAAAETLYGVAFKADLTVDEQATTQLRTAARQPRPARPTFRTASLKPIGSMEPILMQLSALHDH
jgi:N-methylhydantoinase B